MPIPRLQLFELEDQPWFPAVVRDLATDYLRFMEAKFALHRPVVALLGQALREAKADHVVDLCSGGAGPIPSLQRDLTAEGLAVRFTLTDQFPNLPAFQQAANGRVARAVEGGAAEEAVTFVAEPIDARAVPARLRGFRTMFNAFHHFRPSDAVAVLRDAAQARQPIGIFEIPERTLQNLMPMLLLTPLMVAVATPFIRPFRWHRLLWTYIIPLVPLTCWCDGFVSQLRAYTPAEMQGLADAVSTENYTWHAGQVPIGSTPGRLTYLLGSPTGPLASEQTPQPR